MVKRLILWMLIGVFTPHTLCNIAPLVGHQIWEINGGTDMTPSDLSKEGLLDILRHKKTSQEVLVKAQDIDKVKNVLNKRSISYQVLIEDLASHIQNVEMQSERSRREATIPAQVCVADSCPHPLSDDFMSIKQMEHYLEELEKNHGDKVTVKSIGKSHENNDIWLVHIKSTNKDADTVWIEAGIHAREWISSAVGFGLIDKLIHNDELRNKAEFYLTPMANPDGYEYSRTTNRYWRKNRKPGLNCDGVDLNRNWDYKFGVGASDNECSETYKGLDAFSEPETMALSKAMADLKSKTKLLISLHSYGSDLLYPYGWTTNDVPNKAELIKAGNSFKNAALKSTAHKYDVINSCGGLYYASGATDDYAYGVLEVPYVYTIELRGSGFVIPKSEIKPAIQENWYGLLALIENVQS